MIKNKKGLSAVITTLLVVLLVLVAVGIVWAVVRNLVQTGAGGVELGAKCLNIDVSAVSASCNDSLCNVVVERSGSNTDEIAGIKLVIKDSSTAEASGITDSEGNIEVLATKTISDINVSGLSTPDTAEVTVYFIDNSGNEQLCSQTTSFSF